MPTTPAAHDDDTVRHHMTHVFLAHEPENTFERLTITTASDDEGPIDDLFDVTTDGTQPLKLTRVQLLELADSIRSALG